jgi:NAD(P)-dependent dehydrogenase (short-subunit alcohol dehydrogenase family)
VNTLAPYLLAALIDRPDRLIYLSSGLHYAAAGSLADIDWTRRPWNAAQAYAESKLQVTALALTLARAWPEVLSNAVDPGWVPTKMGGLAATGDLELGYLTQTWLAVSNDTAATVSGGYWYHRQRREPAAEARDPAFQDQLMDRLAGLTGVALFQSVGSGFEPLAPHLRKRGLLIFVRGTSLRPGRHWLVPSDLVRPMREL